MAIPGLCIREAVKGTAALFVAGLLSAICSADPPPPAKIPITLPGGFVVVLGGPLPKSDSVTIPADKYRELQERVERLQAIVDAAQPIRPRSCELDGRIEQRGRQAVVRLKATFKVTTTRPDVIAYLGCQRAHAVEARGEDGKAPLLVSADDGLRVQLPTAGEHTIRLELDCPLMQRGPKGSELGFEIGLPGAAITTLALEPPANVKQYTLSMRAPKGSVVGAADSEIEQAEVERFLPAKGGSPLGAIGSLIVAWEDPTRKAEAVRSVDGDITVTVGPDDLTTEARLRLRGPATEWRFTAPATADVTVGPSVNPAGGKQPVELAPGRAPNVVRPEPGQTIWRVEVRDPTANDLLVTIATRTPRRRDAAGRGPFPIGPFAVLDVTQQAGVIRIRTPLTVKATATIHGDCKREVDDTGGESVFHYRYLPLKVAPTEPPVVLTLATATGVVHARTRSSLRSTDTGWKLRAEVSLSPSRAEMDEVDVEVPDGFRLTDVEPREIVESFAPERSKGASTVLYRLRLTGPRRTSFTLMMLGEYTGRPNATSVSLLQPRLLGVVGRGSEVLVETPVGREVRGSFRTWEGGQIGNSETPLEVDGTENSRRLHGSADGLAARVDLQLQAAAAGSRSRVEADVDIGPQRVVIAEKLAFHFIGRAPARVRLRTAANIHDLRSSRGTLEQVNEAWDLVVADGDPAQEFQLTYWVPSPVSGEDFSVPLLEPEPVANSRLVRFWASSTTAVQLREPSDWRVAPVEIVPGRAMLPDLVLCSNGPAQAPVVAIADRSRSADEGPSIIRLQAAVRLGDTTDYRVRFVVQNCTRGTEIVMPVGARNLEVSVQGKRLPEGAIGSADPTTIRIPPLVVEQDSVVIQVRYRMPGGPTNRLEIPRLTRSDLVGDVIWSIVPRTGRLALQSGDVVNAWSWRFLQDSLGMHINRGNAPTDSTLVVRTTQQSELHIVEVPRLGWVLAWSVVATLGLSVLSFARCWRVRYVVASVLVVIGLVGAFSWPQPLALALVAMVPGVFAMCLLAMGYRAMQSRYRYRMVHFPGFARPGSSLVRPSVVRVNEPSKNGSSAGSAGKATPSVPAELQ